MVGCRAGVGERAVVPGRMRHSPPAGTGDPGSRGQCLSSPRALVGILVVRGPLRRDPLGLVQRSPVPSSSVGAYHDEERCERCGVPAAAMERIVVFRLRAGTRSLASGATADTLMRGLDPERSSALATAQVCQVLDRVQHALFGGCRQRDEAVGAGFGVLLNGFGGQTRRRCDRDLQVAQTLGPVVLLR